MDKKNNVHKFVNTFNPDISVMNIDCRDYLLDFHAGIGNENFNDFLKKALFLHSISEAEQFYHKNGFQDMTHNMLPFASIDSDMRPMWLPLKNIHMNYDK